MESVLKAALGLPLEDRSQLLRELLQRDTLSNSGLGITGFKAKHYNEGLSPPAGGSECLVVSLGGLTTVFGCPWCRRPLRFVQTAENERQCDSRFVEHPPKVIHTD